MGSEVQDGYLVQRAQEGYLDAYAELVDRHAALAYRVALRVLGNHHDAEDVAQEALITAWQQLPGFTCQSSFSTWLYQIVTRKALNRIRRRSASDVSGLPDDSSASSDEPASRVEGNLTVGAVTDAVLALPPAQRIAIVLRHFEGLSNPQIASITGDSVPAVRSHLFRGRRTLTKTLKDWT